MNTIRKTVSAQLALRKTPTTGTGEFEAVIATWVIDHDHERFDRHAFDGQIDKRVELRYHHNLSDPKGVIGWAVIRPTDEGLIARGRLSLEDKMALAVYERMLLPPGDPRALREFSISFAYLERDTTIGPEGERVFLKAEVLEVSVVYAGAQLGTRLRSLKSASSSRELLARRIRETLDLPPLAIGSRDWRSSLESVKARIAQVAEDPRPTIDADAVREMRAELEQRLRAELEAEERRKAAHRELDQYHLANMSAPAVRVEVDSHMRVVRSDDDEREKDRREYELRAIEARHAERQREAENAPRPEPASLAVLPLKRRERA